VPDTIGRGLSQCSPVPERELPRFLCPPSDRAYCQLQFLGGAECHLPTSLDFDWLTRHGIATHTGRSIPYLQNAETGDLHSLTFLKMLCDHADQVIEHLLTSAPAEVMLVREHGDQAFLGDRPGDFWHGRGG
jgi:hypothetical protein